MALGKTSARRPDAPPPLNLWRVRDFLIVWWAQVTSRIGTQISQFVLPLLVLSSTGSASTAGMIAALEQLPYLILAIPAGALVETWNKQVVMVVGNFTRAVLFGLLAGYLLSGGTSILFIAGTVLCSGIVYVFFDQASSTVFPRILPAHELARASGWVEGTTAMTEVLGPALGGALIGLGTTTMVGAGYAFGADAITYIIAGIGVLCLRTSLRPTAVRERQGSLRASIREGITYLFSHAELRLLALANFVNIAVLGTVWLSFMTLMKTEFHIGSSGTGLLLSLGALSGVLGSFCSGILHRRLGAYGVMLFTGLGWAAGELIMAIAPAPWVAVFGLALALWVAPPYFATLYAHRMAIIPQPMHTRINSMYRLLAQAGLPLGLAGGGVLLEFVGARGFLLLAAAVFLAAAITVQLHVRSGRNR
ncbi:MFS transporter [Streptomyces sp. SID8352]|uniref:MFS transporter n=1 Tax=Streptomyces sp. SID8352 TaxID=2690338 RepID=UPI00136E2950|nr:MFS transporter [Streptomyces sp. SID8352]MYU23651.1 MFS transporter [Streptomyces sp. SID8352]